MVAIRHDFVNILRILRNMIFENKFHEVLWCQTTSLMTPDAFTSLPESSGPFSRTSFFIISGGFLVFSQCPLWCSRSVHVSNCPMVQCPSVQVSKFPNVQVSLCPSASLSQESKCPCFQVPTCPSVQVSKSKCPSIQVFCFFQVGRVLRTPSHPQDECPKFRCSELAPRVPNSN